MRTRVTARLDDLVGLAEIADIAGVSRQAVSNWTVRHGDFPQPVLHLAMGPIFLRSAVKAWLRTRTDQL